VVVVLGTPNAESSRLYAMTVTAGDPSWAGALAGVALGLPVYHITEADIKDQISPQAYDEHIALMEVVLEVDDIAKAVEEVRSTTGQQAGS
jgi:betaine reductase